MTLAAARSADVVVLGGGLAGMATALQLARHGLVVVCVEPRRWPRDAVGESLEFSAPRLLDRLHLDTPIHGEATHPKSAVRIVGRDDRFTVWPPPFFARPPIWCSRETFHTDRRELDRRIMETALAAGVEVVEARVRQVHHRRQRISHVTLDDGTQLHASWFVDASGHRARLVGRALRLDREVSGARRHALWTRVAAHDPGDATTLHFGDTDDEELTWLWEIPLSDREVSLGLVLGEAALRRHRGCGRGPKQILDRHLETIHGAMTATLRHGPLDVHATSYLPYRHLQPVGPNWILVGDASAMVDPLTSNGVTSALRHAELAADLVGRAHAGCPISLADAVRYRATAPALAGALNHAIESFVYDPAIRRRFGLRTAVNLYAATGVVTNALYARLDPATAGRASAAIALPALAGAWTGVAHRVAAQLPAGERRRRRSPRPAAPSRRGVRHRGPASPEHRTPASA